MNQIHSYTLALIRYLISGEVPEKPSDIDFCRLRQFGIDHGIENMIYAALNDLQIDVPENIMADLQEDYEMQIVLEANQAYELECIGEAFAEEGIDYVPMKGSVVKHYYPMPDYRKSGDIDILMRSDDSDKVCAVLERLGFEREKTVDKYDLHISFIKQPYIEVEMHRALVRQENRAYKFCRNAWDHVVKDSGTGYRLTNEFHYVYLIAHICHHLYHGGAGIKLITDIFVVRNKLNMDMELIDKYLKMAELYELHEMLMKLIGKWFCGQETDDKDIQVLEKIILTGGSFGTAEMRQKMHSSNTGSAKTGIMLKRVFLSGDRLRMQYPEWSRYPTAVIWVLRLFRILFKKRSKAMNTIKNTFDSSSSDSELNNIVRAVCEK